MNTAIILSSLLGIAALACHHDEDSHPAQPPGPTAGVHAAESCGELAMTRAGLIAEGRGEKHPEVVDVDALLAHCTDRTPSPEACHRVANELTEATANGYGPNHPKVRSLKAKLALCPG